MPEQTVPGLRYNWLPHEEKYGRAIEALEDENRRLAAEHLRTLGLLAHAAGERDRYKRALVDIVDGSTIGNGYDLEQPWEIAEKALRPRPITPDPGVVQS